MIYNCKEPGCNFTSFNEKALALHTQEKHKQAPHPVAKDITVVKEENNSTPIKEETAGLEQQQEPQSQKNHKPQRFNFLITMKDKTVTVESTKGKTITGILRKFNDYELLIQTATGLVIVMKHAVWTIQENTSIPGSVV